MRQKAKFYPEGFRTESWNSIEIHACRIEEEGGDESIVRCEDGKQDFYSLYAVYKMPNGHLESSCIADIPEKEEAEKLKQMFYSIINSIAYECTQGN